MKFSILLFLAMINTAWGGTFDCSIYKGFHENETTLIQTAFAEDDEEENSEEYALLYEQSVRAYVSYLPYQNGVDLHLDSVDQSVSANANFAQEDGNYDDSPYMELELKLGGITYTLACIVQ